MNSRRLWYSDLALALLARFIFGFGTYLDVLPALSFLVHPRTVPCALYLVSRIFSPCSQDSTSKSLVFNTFL